MISMKYTDNILSIHEIIPLIGSLSKTNAGEVRAKKPSITLNLRTNSLKVTSEPPPTLSGHSSKQQPLSTLPDLVILR
ncbi:hypothetical protein J6590_079975 [Homalodisca vitripennis]|nr:hypothetical protein J6590_079975 [Homalodisca vitripennis]